MTRRTALCLAAIGLALLGAGCAAGPIDRPPAATGLDVEAIRSVLARELGVIGVQLRDPQVPFRPGEAPALAAAPRAVFQAVLPEDPGHGFISAYVFGDNDAATAAAIEQAAYVASGPGRVQFPPDTRFVLRQLGRTVVFFAWSPANSPDPRTPEVAKVLEGMGIEIPVPN